MTAPAPRVANAYGSAPVVQGTAGTAAGDEGAVTVELFAGGSPTGAPVQTVTASRDGLGAYTARFGEVGGGSYTVRARQRDAAGNTGLSAMTFATAAQEGPPAFGASTEVTVRAASRIPVRGPVAVVVTNRNPFAVTGRLAGLTLRRLSVGGARKRYVALRAKTVNVRARASQRLRLALPRALHAPLRRGGRIALRLSVSVRDPAGTRRVVTKRVTPRVRRR